MDKASLALGYLVGQQIAGQRKAEQKQAIAYLYNGTRLPALPERDKTVYPCVYMSYTESDAGIYAIYAFTKPKHLTGATSEEKPWIAFEEGESFLYSSGLWLSGYSDGRTFKEFGEYTYPPEGVTLTSGLPIWASYDIYNADGTLYLAASDPIPVYE